MNQLKKLFTGRMNTPLPANSRELVEDNFVSWYVSESIANFLVAENPPIVPNSFIKDVLHMSRLGRIKKEREQRKNLDEKVLETFKDTDLAETTREAISDITWDVYKTLEMQGVFETTLIGDDNTIPSISRLPPNGTLRKNTEKYFDDLFNHQKPVYRNLVSALKLEEDEFSEGYPDEEEHTTIPSPEISALNPSSAEKYIENKISRRNLPFRRPLAQLAVLGACAFLPATLAGLGVCAFLPTTQAGTAEQEPYQSSAKTYIPEPIAPVADADSRVACEGRVLFQPESPTYRQLRQRSTEDMFENSEQYRALITQIVDCAAQNSGEVYLSAYANMDERDRLQQGSRRLDAFTGLRGRVVLEDIQREAESRDLQIRVMMDSRGRTDAFGEGSSTVVFSTLRYTPDVEGRDTPPDEIEWQRNLPSGTILRTPRSVRLAMLSPEERVEQPSQPNNPEYNREPDAEYPSQHGLGSGTAPASIVAAEAPATSSIDVQRLLQRAQSLIARCRDSDTDECRGLNISVGEETVVETGMDNIPEYDPVRIPSFRDEPVYPIDEVEEPTHTPTSAQGMVLATYTLPPGTGDTPTLLRDDGTVVGSEYEEPQEESELADPSPAHTVEAGGFQRDNPFDDSPSIDTELPEDADEAALSQRILQLRGEYVGVSRQVAELVGRGSCASVNSLITDYFEMQDDLDAHPEISGSGRRATERAEQREELTSRLAQVTERIHQPAIQNCLREYRRVIRAVIDYENQVSTVCTAVQERLREDDNVSPQDSPLFRSADALEQITASLISPIDLRYNEEFVNDAEIFR